MTARVVVTDAVPAAISAVAEKFGAEPAASPEALLGAGVDGVVIAAATNAHAALVRAGVEAGVPVFCEKGAAGPRRFHHLAVPGHRPPADRRHRPGRADPAGPQRVARTHLKEVDNSIAEKVRSGRLTYADAVKDGLYRPLGTGDVNVESILKTLRENDYQGWSVLEQDTVLTEAPAGEGPVRDVRDVRTSAAYVRSLLG